MDVMGEALMIDRTALLRLAEEAEVSTAEASKIIVRMCDVAGQFAAIVGNLYPAAITRDRLHIIQGRIDQNIALLR
ncbi:hypothetical protein [Pusillimonas sp. ANT_WB101]|uniref:hypothetical protein n=1 Tax=Pusillimonas sp. ANT_WB101 TaxID=2597356 RepID=UPI0011EC1D47|nr:hypothetical protein [Pusillimonas sp. ANT_WB101]KAA0911181.1 hypothetical protein FQ179_04835 [Pusillimonas sp. ANT_WB101]